MNDNTKLYSILAYIGILFIVGLIADPQNPRVKFHCNQGLLLCLLEFVTFIAIAILGTILFAISFTLIVLTSLLYFLAAVGFIALSIYGIINAANGQEKRLPIIGKFDIIK